MKNLVEISRGDIAGQFVHEAEFLAGTLKDSHMLKTVLKREPSYFSALESALNMADASQRYKACQNLGLKLSSQKETMQAGAFCYLLANASRSEEITHELKKIVIDLSQFSVEIQKKHEEAERIIEEEFNSFIESSEPIDQGAYSLIYKMDIASQPQNFKTALKEEGVPGQDSAIKVLKVYEPGLVESEYKRQVLGRQIFTKAG